MQKNKLVEYASECINVKTAFALISIVTLQFIDQILIVLSSSAYRDIGGIEVDKNIRYTILQLRSDDH